MSIAKDAVMESVRWGKSVVTANSENLFDSSYTDMLVIVLSFNSSLPSNSILQKH